MNQSHHTLESKMLKSLRTFVVGSVLGSCAALATAGPAEVAHSAASQASSVAVKVEGAVKRGAKTAASAVERGVHRAASAAEHGASVAGQAIDKTARRLGLPAASAPAAQQ
jgi:hypothetical protein